MEKEFWLTKWEAKEITWDQQDPNPFLLEYFGHFNLQPGSRIFVPLCGKNIDMLWLANQGYQVIGVDLSLKACQLFFSEYQIPYEQSKKGQFEVLTSEKITLLAGDFFDLDRTLLGEVEGVYDRAALVALPLETRAQYALKMIDLMPPYAQMLIVTLDFDQAQIPGPPFSVSGFEIQKLFGERFHLLALYNQPFLDIPPHLCAKGLNQAQTLVFRLAPL